MTAIAYLISEYPAVSHTFISREIRVLRQRGFRVETVSVNPTANPEALAAEDRAEIDTTLVLKEIGVVRILWAIASVFFRNPSGFSAMVLKAIGFRVSPLKTLGYLMEAVLLIPWLRRNGITHVHEHFGNPTAFVAILLKTFGGFTYSISLHGPDIFYRVDRERLREKIAGARFVRCISHYCRSQVYKLVGEGGQNAHLVRCGVDPNRFRPDPGKRPRRQRILCVGRLCAAKGQEILIRACASLQSNTFELVFVGGGDRREELERLAEELEVPAVFTGPLGQDKVLAHYREADLFVLPSYAEGLPVVLMEAMAMGLPVVSTHVNGIPELVRHRENGLLVAPSSSEQLAEAIQMLLDDPEWAEGLGRAARDKVIAEYDQTVNNDRLGDLFAHYEVA